MLVPPGNYQALAESIELLVRNKKLCDEMGKRAVEHVVAKFRIDREVEDTISVYLQVLGRQELPTPAK